MIEWRCTTHNIRFAAERDDRLPFVKCPICKNEELAALALRLAAADEHVTLLLKAIDLKRTLIATGKRTR